MAFTIRDATHREAALAAELIRRSFRDVADRFGLTSDNCPKHPSNCTPEWIEAELAEGVRYFIAEGACGPCGCVGLKRAGHALCYLERLAVLPNHRSRGIGTALVERVLQEARQLGAAHVSIGIIADHSELKEWYQRRGFAVTEKRHFDHLSFEVTFMLIDLRSAEDDANDPQD